MIYLLLLNSSHPSLYQDRKLASVCRKIFSLGNCIGNVGRLTNRNIFVVVNSAMNWNSMVSLTPGCVDELNFWKVNLLHISSVCYSVPLWPIKCKPSRVVYSDTSISACGSFVTLDDKVFHQNPSGFERSRSSRVLELLDVLLSKTSCPDWTNLGVLTPVTDLLVITTPSFQNTRFYQPGTSGVNAFAQDWSNDKNWLCPHPPPACLTCKVLRHLKACNATGTLLWFPFIFASFMFRRFALECFRPWLRHTFWSSKFVCQRQSLEFNLRPRFSSIPFDGSAYWFQYCTLQGSGLVCEAFRDPDF